jgi:hypothetical protein
MKYKVIQMMPLHSVLPVQLSTFISPFNDQNKREYSWKILNSNNTGCPDERYPK